MSFSLPDRRRGGIFVMILKIVENRYQLAISLQRFFQNDITAGVH